MSASRFVLRAAAVAVLSWLPAPVAAQTQAEEDCRAAIAGAMVKYTTAVFKTTAKCHRSRSRGKVGLDVECHDVAQADAAGKLDRMRSATTVAIASPSSACAQAGPGLLANYGRCPTPAAAADDGEVSEGIDSYAELAACLIGLTDGLIGSATRDVMGSPDVRPDVVLRRCQDTLAKGAAKLARTYARERVRCQAALDAQAAGLEYGCTGADPRQKIARARAKLLADIGARCAFADPVPASGGNERLDVIGACGDTVDQLRTCVADIVVDRVASGLVAASYELPSSCRVDRLVRTSYAGFGSRLRRTSLSAGWNGLAHDIDFNDGFSDVLSLDCDPDCASCALSIDPAKDLPLSFCRCASDASVSCDVINGPDPDDCTGLNNACQCHFGPPLGAAAAGNPACIPIRIVQDYSGTVDLGSGDWANPIKVVAGVHLGFDVQAPCPLCEGDVTANDGVRDGACSGGARSGQPCDRNGIHPTFGNVSIDCQPQALTNISGSGLLLSFELLSRESSLPFSLPCDSPGGLCPCRVCAGDTSIGCRDDAECPGATGPCTGGGGAGVQPNQCADRVCGADGTCPAGPIDRFCDGTVHPNGDGLLSCNSDLDCSLNGNGACTISQPRRCYPDPITVDGEPGPFGAEVGGLACIGLTTSAVINVASGLPGAVKVALDFDAEPSCAGDPATPWHPPGGANCAMTTSTTTTTLLPPLPCVASIPPACGGDCPAGEVCASNGLTCSCEPSSTTTTLPATGCAEQTFPLCAQGACPAGSTCQLDLNGLACACTPGTECGDTLFPICGGSCPLGQSCQGDVLGLACACGP